MSAGPDIGILWPEASVALTGVATAHGLPASGITVQWSAVSGPGTVTFGDTGQLVTTAQFSAPGTYELQLQVVDCVRAVSDTLTVTVADRSDLVVQAVDVSGVLTDGQTLAVSGSAAATIANVGAGPAGATFTVTFFEDSNDNGTFEPAEDNPLGSAIQPGLAPGGSAVVTAAAGGDRAVPRQPAPRVRGQRPCRARGRRVEQLRPLGATVRSGAWPAAVCPAPGVVVEGIDVGAGLHTSDDDAERDRPGR